MRFPLCFAVVLIVGCRKAAEKPVDTAGTISITWDGSVKGQLSAEASGLWCPTDSLLEVLALRGDVGVGLSLLSTDTLRVGQHPVLSGAISANWRPLALAGFRYVSDSALKGFEATGGNVNITTIAAGTVSGTLDLRLKVSEGFDTLRIAGSFDRVPYGPATIPCGRLFKPKAT